MCKLIDTWMPFTRLFFLVSRENRRERERGEERRKINRNIGKRKETKRETKNKRGECRFQFVVLFQTSSLLN
jgi:hypothetical protein